MKLTEKELNYILSECIQQMILENDINEEEPQVKTKINTNLAGGKGWGVGNKLQTTGKAIADGIKNGSGFFGKTLGGIKGVTQQVPGLTTMAGGFAAGMMFPTASLPFLLAMLGMGQLIGGINRFRQFATKKIPYNKNAAFKIALRALPEYQNCSKLCQTIQSNFNLSCQAYENIAQQRDWEKTEYGWDDIKNTLSFNEFTLDSGDLKGIRGVTNINQDFTKQDVNESTAPDMQKKQTINTIQKYLSRFDEEDAQFFIQKVGELYANAYHLYFQWKSYLRAIMMKFDISWEEIQKGETTSGKWSDKFNFKGDDAVDKDDLSVDYTIINYIQDATITSSENNKQYIYTIWRDQNNKFYAIYKLSLPTSIDTSIPQRFIFSSNMTNNKTIRFVSTSNGKQYKALLLNDNVFDSLEAVPNNTEEYDDFEEPENNTEQPETSNSGNTSEFEDFDITID